MKKRASTPTRSEWLALIAALEKAQWQVAALREMPDGYGCEDCLAERQDDHDNTMCDRCSAAARKILNDTKES